jgi:signal transduction histidine kinase
MNSEEEQLKKRIVDYTVNVQMITFIVITMVVILTLVNCIRIYSSHKSNILKEMATESSFLSAVISDQLNYSKYFIKLISKSVKTYPQNIERIRDTLQFHFQSREFNLLFGWRKYSWANNEFQEVATSMDGIIKNPKKLTFVENIVATMNVNNKEKDTIFFRINKGSDQTYSLKLINTLFDKETQKFIGSVVLSYDIDTMIKYLNNRKKNSSINFVIIDENLTIVAKSKSQIDKITLTNNKLSPYIIEILKKNTLHSGNLNKDYSYLDMVNGLNYFIKPLEKLPFTVIVNIDHDFIKDDIIKSVAKKFLEVGLLAGVSLIIIISIYKRETSLRTKAEKATILANNATKAKTNFLAFTAHEIRSPLGFILTGSEVMSKELFGRIPSNYTKYVEGIHNNAQIILDFITDILDENQIIEGQFKIVNSLNQIQDIIAQVATSHSGKKNISIVTDFEANLPLLVCDKRRITQVIDNLINNSIKYSNENTIITISVKMNEDQMLVTIIDQGIGMKEHEIPIALSKYGTISKNDYTKGGSYGLGLPIVKMLLDAHEAILNIHSIDGKGTTVKIIFPKFKIVYNKEKN